VNTVIILPRSIKSEELTDHLGSFHLQGWKISPKSWYLSTKLYGVKILNITFQNPLIGHTGKAVLSSHLARFLQTVSPKINIAKCVFPLLVSPMARHSILLRSIR
jgi:hypothetical protein